MLWIEGSPSILDYNYDNNDEVDDDDDNDDISDDTCNISSYL